MRDPVMHIKLTDFTNILANHGFDNPKKLAMRIFQQAVPFNIKDRYLVKTNTKAVIKVNKEVKASRTASMTVQQFNRLLDAERRTIGHRHITPIRPNSPTYLLLKEVALMACDFSNSVGIENIDEGCKIYIQLGLEKMKYSNAYGLNKFKYYDNSIYSTYESYEMIHNDPESVRTKEVHDIYATLLAEYAGIQRKFEKPEEYVCFLYCRLELDRIQADIEDWLRAQFEELGRAFDSIPNPNQLFSDNALKRYYQYFKTPKAEQEEFINVPTSSVSDFTKRYEEKLRTKNAAKE